MSMGYKADVRSESARGPPGSPIAKKRSFQSAPSVKRKPLSAKSAHSSIRAIDSDKLMMPQEKKSSPAIIKTDSRDLEKDKALPQNIKIKNISLIDHKRREFLCFRKQLIQQQNIYIDLYAQLRDLEDRSGVPAGTTVGEVRLLSVTDWPVHDLLLLTENTPNQPQTEVKGILGPKILQQLSSQLTGIPGEVVAMGTELMSRRLDMLEFIRALQRKEKVLDDNNNGEWQTMNAEFEEDTEKLRRLVLATAKSFETKIIHSLDVAKIPWIDRDNMIKKIESLQKELTVNKKAKPVDAVPNDNAHEQQHKNILDELYKERSARLTLKEMLTSAEGKTVSARARITELERQLNANRAELASAHRRLDNLKQLHHYRASNHDANSKKSEKVSKNGDATIGVLSRQRDTLELRVRELQEQTTLLTRNSEARESQLTSQIESLELKLHEQVQNRDSLEARVQELEKSLNDVQEQYNALKEHSRQLVALEHQKNLEYLPRKSQCSNQDIEIWNDLQATKSVLDRVKVELENSRADKNSLLTSLARIAHEGPENKMAEELLNREQKITKMRIRIDELLENKRTMEKNIACCENQLAALRFEVNVLRSFNSYTSQKEIPHQDLETEVFNLCLQVATLKRERAALISEAASRALLLERHERSAELFAQVTRARRALAAQLEGNALPSMDTGDDHEVTTSLTKAYLSSADTWSALRTERARVLQLEDTVRSQQLQLTRESLRRVQHEQRRSNLERELIRTWAGNLRQGHNGVQVASALYAKTLRSEHARVLQLEGTVRSQQLQLTRESLMPRAARAAPLQPRA